MFSRLLLLVLAACFAVKTEELHYTKGMRYRSWEAYGQSNLANLLFAKGLADHIKDSGVANTRKFTAVAPRRDQDQPVETNHIQDHPARRHNSIRSGAQARGHGDETLRGAYRDNCGPTLPSPTGRDTD
ncbi:hypothetical protein B484DRAFT_393713 [Ochromonadaceae sp. CCMP2298]|nr:hypothetical protein B484DRAFT_393713 [Ochromonadaceae sp. CCMP2298]